MSFQSFRRISPGSSSSGPRSGAAIAGLATASGGSCGSLRGCWAGGDGGRRCPGRARERRLPTQPKVREDQAYPRLSLLPRFLLSFSSSLSSLGFSSCFFLPSIFFISLLLLLSAVFQRPKSICIHDN